MNITGPGGQGIVSYEYDDFGGTTVRGDQNYFNEICYTGGIYDRTTGLYYLNARYYDPADGRFLTQDTYRGEAGDPSTLHLYAYCKNNPISYSDPTGHWFWAAVNVAFAAYDGYKAYKAGKKQGLSGAKLAKKVAISAGSSLIGGKYIKAAKTAIRAVKAIRTGVKVAKKATPAVKQAVRVAKKVITSKPAQKAASKAKNVAQKYRPAKKPPTAPKHVPAKAAPKGGKPQNQMGLCFVAGTKVSTPEGLVPIEEIREGDYVWSEDVDSGRLEPKMVEQLIRSEANVLVKLTIDGELIETTMAHPFWVEGKGWVSAGSLLAGDTVKLQSGEFSFIEKVEIVTLDAPVVVYNFSVAEFHTYFVSGSKVLVHNRKGNSCTVDPNKRPHRKKQGRETGKKNRGKDNFESRANNRNPKSPKKHTPGKDHRKY
jgi:RHS repeat-associated protein